MELLHTARIQGKWRPFHSSLEKDMSLELIGFGPFSNWVGRYIFYVSSFLLNFLSIFIVKSVILNR